MRRRLNAIDRNTYCGADSVLSRARACASEEIINRGSVVGNDVPRPLLPGEGNIWPWFAGTPATTPRPKAEGYSEIAKGLPRSGEDKAYAGDSDGHSVISLGLRPWRTRGSTLATRQAMGEEDRQGEGNAMEIGNDEEIGIHPYPGSALPVTRVRGRKKGSAAIRVAVQLKLEAVEPEPDWALLDEMYRQRPVSSPVASQIAAWAKTQRHGANNSVVRERAVVRAELEKHLAANEWEKCRPAHAVELYAMLHERVYGIAPEEFASVKVRVSAVRTVADMLRRHFNNDMAAMLGFVRWCWVREETRHKWRQANHMETRRMNWRWQFGPSMLTDYKMDQASRGGD